MLGGTEYVAESCQEALTELGHQATVHLSPIFTEIPQKDQSWLICTSTHGAGDYPDNLLSFVSDLEGCDQDLNHMPFFVIGLGDSNYDTFCLAAKNITKSLLSKGCNEIVQLKTIDMDQDLDPEEVAREWVYANKDHLSRSY